MAANIRAALASVLYPGDRVVDLTTEFILVEKADRLRTPLRFMRLDS